MATQFLTHKFGDLTTGNSIIVTGGVHGDEQGPVEAINGVMNDLNTSLLMLKKGGAYFIPVSNPKASDAGVRQIDDNMNRVMGFHEHPQNYEEEMADRLAHVMQEFAEHANPHGYERSHICVHTTLRETHPHILIPEATPQNLTLAKSMGLKYILISNRAELMPAGAPSTTTTKFANSLGLPAITVECGQHDAKSVITVADNIIRRTMAMNGMTDEHHEPITTASPRIYKFSQILKNDQISHYTDSEGRPATGPNGGCPEQFKAYKRGEAVAKRVDGTLIYASIDDTRIVMPNNGVNDGVKPQKSGSEQFSLAVPYTT